MSSNECGMRELEWYELVFLPKINDFSKLGKPMRNPALIVTNSKYRAEYTVTVSKGGEVESIGGSFVDDWGVSGTDISGLFEGVEEELLFLASLIQADYTYNVPGGHREGKARVQEPYTKTVRGMVGHISFDVYLNVPRGVEFMDDLIEEIAMGSRESRDYVYAEVVVGFCYTNAHGMKNGIPTDSFSIIERRLQLSHWIDMLPDEFDYVSLAEMTYPAPTGDELLSVAARKFEEGYARCLVVASGEPMYYQSLTTFYDVPRGVAEL